MIPISLGYNCRPYMHLHRLGHTRELPFDVVLSIPLFKVAEALETKFKSLLSPEYYVWVDNTNLPAYWYNYVSNFSFFHSNNPDINKHIEAYRLRVNAYYEAMLDSVCFIRENADREEFKNLLKQFNVSGILINYGKPGNIVYRDERLIEWNVCGVIAEHGTDRLGEDAHVWDNILADFNLEPVPQVPPKS